MVQESGESRGSHEHESGEELTNEKLAEAQQKSNSVDSDVDAILDEIDDVLETNAEDFVKSFIQKGGQ